MGYFDFQKKSDCIVCIDSDGCAMDTMEVKHRTCFGPQWIKTFGLTEHEAECMELWLSINLYSITRGINRFKGLALALAEVEKRGLGNIEGLAEYEAWTKEAIRIDSDFVKAFASLAKELRMAIGLTLLEETAGGPRNTLVLFDRFGEQKWTYAKVHTCDFDVERNLCPGEDFYVTALDTALGQVQVGGMICYDREYPESARILMLKGAEIILVPNDCGSMQPRIRALSTRAYELSLIHI